MQFDTGLRSTNLVEFAGWFSLSRASAAATAMTECSYWTPPQYGGWISDRFGASGRWLSIVSSGSQPEELVDRWVAWAWMMAVSFDLGVLFRAADDERRREGLTWTALAALVGVSATTMRRFGTADDAEADGVLAVVRWLGAAPEDFVNGGTVRGRDLPSEPNGYVRVDMEAVARALGQRGNGRRTRTTIQHLVGVAEQSGLPVALLTRVSPI